MLLEYVLDSYCKGNLGQSRSIHGPYLVPRGTLDPDANVPTHLAF